MEEILFDSYRKYQKNHKGSTIKALFRLPATAIVLLIMSCVCLALNIFVILFDWIPILGVVCLVAELIVCITLYFYTDNYQIKTSDTRMKTYAKYCTDLLTWIDNTDFSVTKANMEIIIDRVNTRIEAKQMRNQANQQRFDKWCQALLFPVVLAVFSAAIKNQTDIVVMLAYAATLLVTIGLVYLAIYHCINMLLFFEKRRIAQMKSFAEDLQAIIDIQFDNFIVTQ